MTDCYRPLIVALCRDRVAHPRQRELHARLRERLRGYSGVTVRELPHLYDLPPDGPAINYLRAVEGDLLVAAWMYTRAMLWVLAAHGITGRIGATRFFPIEELTEGEREQTEPEPNRMLWLVDLRPHHDPEPLLAEIERIVVERGGPPMPSATAPTFPALAASADFGEVIDEPTRPRWYPVIDYHRCRTCMECLNFCLFGVFGLDGRSRLLVEQPDACRNGCPACARVCPSQAIMFPEHQNPAIVGEVRAPAGDLNADLVALFGPRPAADLAQRERAAFTAQKGSEGEKPINSPSPGKVPDQTSSPAPNEARTLPDNRDELDDWVDQIDRGLH